MKFESHVQLKQIGEIIRSTAVSSADRWFKSEMNTPQYAKLVLHSIIEEIRVNLVLSGVLPYEQMNEIDPTDDVLAAMIQRGYSVSRSLILDSKPRC